MAVVVTYKAGVQIIPTFPVENLLSHRKDSKSFPNLEIKIRKQVPSWGTKHREQDLNP